MKFPPSSTPAGSALMFSDNLLRPFRSFSTGRIDFSVVPTLPADGPALPAVVPYFERFFRFAGTLLEFFAPRRPVLQKPLCAPTPFPSIDAAYPPVPPPVLRLAESLHPFPPTDCPSCQHPAAAPVPFFPETPAPFPAAHPTPLPLLPPPP